MKRPSHNSSSRRQFLGASAGGLMLNLLPFAAHAKDDYPSHPVTVIVPYAPGGQGDVFARLLAQPMGDSLGQTWVVENRPGASGLLGTRQVIRSKPDGLTLLLGQTGEAVVIPLVNKAAGYDTLKDLEPVVLVGNSPLVLLVGPQSPYKTVEELIAAARQSPDNVAYASSGTATPGHLAAVALESGTKTKMIHVPYKGAGQAMTDIMGGQVGFFFSSLSAAAGHIKSGAVRALAITTKERLPAWPDLPTIHETVLPEFNYSLWGGVFAPKGTDAGIIATLNQQINAALALPELRDRFIADGSAVASNTPDEFRAFVSGEVDKYRALIEQNNITID
ncbi:Bug family tripartite tricarboxylate transporter substrate binding protein [Paracandidimonas soli]|uniref:Bug family tripartite tricarboxylate transporter substrate binding protein n=1 Tax=Paracandidimonas soli TaxID=1917182 RepID=UPI003342BEAD